MYRSKTKVREREKMLKGRGSILWITFIAKRSCWLHDLYL